jgi:hypothetical protein
MDKLCKFNTAGNYKHPNRQFCLGSRWPSGWWLYFLNKILATR